MIDDAARELDDKKRRAIWNQLLSRVNDQVFIIPLFQIPITLVHTDRVKVFRYRRTERAYITFDLSHPEIVI